MHEHQRNICTVHTLRFVVILKHNKPSFHCIICAAHVKATSQCHPPGCLLTAQIETDAQPRYCRCCTFPCQPTF